MLIIPDLVIKISVKVFCYNSRNSPIHNFFINQQPLQAFLNSNIVTDIYT